MQLRPKVLGDVVLNIFDTPPPDFSIPDWKKLLQLALAGKVQVQRGVSLTLDTENYKQQLAEAALDADFSRSPRQMVRVKDKPEVAFHNQVHTSQSKAATEQAHSG